MPAWLLPLIQNLVTGLTSFFAQYGEKILLYLSGRRDQQAKDQIRKLTREGTEVSDTLEATERARQQALEDRFTAPPDPSAPDPHSRVRDRQPPWKPDR